MPSLLFVPSGIFYLKKKKKGKKLALATLTSNESVQLLFVYATFYNSYNT